MVNKFVSLIMVLLIGNPVCCCFAADLFMGGGDTPAKATHSCCMAVEGADEEGDEQKPDSCPCLLEKEQVPPDHYSFSLKSSDLEKDSESSAIADYAVAIPRVPLAVSHISKWPPGALPIPCLSERLALHSSYLL